MFDEGQATLGGEIVVGGIGIHGGRYAVVTLRPAPADMGVVIERHGRLFRVDPSCVSRVPLCTRLTTPFGHVDTVEHLMAALAITGIDNCIIAIDGDEVPILDGSALPWALMINDVGLKRGHRPRATLEIRKPFRFEIGSSIYEASPIGDRISVSVDFENTVIGIQSASATWASATSFLDARTFVFEKDIATIRAQGFARGGSMENAVIVGERGVLNPTGLRGADEIARHKALDLIGDLFIAGKRISGSITAIRPGHSANNAFLTAMLGSGVLVEASEKRGYSFQIPWSARSARYGAADAPIAVGA
jgi:UDP-3-O-[3-hydroxymyristoyl] N-acetylglucosamine deacetylase